MSGEDPPNYGLPDDNAPAHRVYHPRDLGAHLLRSQQAAVVERAAQQPPMQQVIHPHRVQAHPMHAAAELAAQYAAHLRTMDQPQPQAQPQMQQQMQIPQPDFRQAQVAAALAAALNHQRQHQAAAAVYHPQQQQAPAAVYHHHMHQQPQQAVQQQWFAVDDHAQAMNDAAQRPPNPFVQGLHIARQRQQQPDNQLAQAQLDMLRDRQAAAMRAAAARAEVEPNVAVHMVAGPQQLAVGFAAHAAQAAGAAARAAHAGAHAHQVHQVQIPVHHGVLMMRAQQPAANYEAPEVRAIRLKAERDANEDADNLARRYSRACFICTNPNPLRRAVLVACGHIICSPCAEEAKGSACHLKCPFCRKPSSFVKIFEDEAKEDEEQQQQPPPKRRNDMDDPESPPTNESVQ